MNNRSEVLAVAILVSSSPVAAIPPASELAAAFGARPAVNQVSLSPDGAHVAFVVPIAGQGSALYVAETKDGAEAKRVASASGQPERLASCRWASDTRLVCVIFGQKPRYDLRAPGGAWGISFESLVALPADGGDRAQPPRQVSLGFGEVVDWLPRDHDAVLVRGLGWHRIDIVSGQMRNAAPYGASGDFITDGLGTIRVVGTAPTHLVTGLVGSADVYQYRPVGSSVWKPLSTSTRRSGEGFAPVAVDPETDRAWGYRKVDGRFAVYTKALDAGGEERHVYSRPEVDMSGIVQIGRRQHIVAVQYVTDALHFHYTDSALAALAVQLEKALPATPIIRIVDASDDERKLLILAASDVDPGRYYVLDRNTKHLQPLLQVRPQLDGIKLAPVKVVSYVAADGTSVPAYLTLPLQNAKPGRAIVLPHGGPSARDEWGFDWIAQYYAARGYAVLQPNFRGSWGYGDSFQRDEGFRRWRVAVADIDSGARWLVAQGIASADRLAIFGWSYGGYAALQAAALDPALYRAIIAVAPVTDLRLIKGPAAHTFARMEVNYFVGDDADGEASPVMQAHLITAPVLLAHGTFDLNVPYEHSKRMAARLMAAGHAPTMLTFDRLDHQLDDAAARAKLLEQSDAFIASAMNKVP